MGREDPGVPADPADLRQNLPVLRPNPPSMHREIQGDPEVRGDREARGDREDPVGLEDHLRLLLKHQRHRHQVSVSK